jgi:glycosyltransferase involved in cell wall biosynthesis
VRVAWILYGSVEQRTGGTIYDHEVIRGLRQLGDTVDVLSIDRAAGARNVGSTLPPVSEVARTGQAAVKLARRLDALRPDIVVGDELCFAELAITFRILARFRPNPRRVLLVHHLSAWEPEFGSTRRALLFIAERLAFLASDQVIATSQATRARLLHDGVRAHVDVALPGADRLPKPSAERRPRNGTHFLFVGAMSARKRVVELTSAFAKSSGPRDTLELIGNTHDTTYVRSVAARVASEGIGDRVTMPGEVDESAVAFAMSQADALVMPSSLEGYGIAATEAITSGLPVIAARAQGLEEALRPCPDACLFADDPPALENAIARFSRDANLRERMRRAALASTMPTWAACTTAFRRALKP